MTTEKVYWDSCCFIHFFQQKHRPYYLALAQIAKAAESREIIIVTSTVSFAEVCKLPDLGGLPISQSEIILKFMEHDYIEKWSADAWVCKEAHNIIRLLGLKPMDAIHMATAKMANVSVCYSTDTKKYRRDGLIAHTNKLGFPIVLPGDQPMAGNLFTQPDNNEQ